MRNVIQLKKAAAVEVGEHILAPQYGTGILLGFKVISTEVIDNGKRVEIGTSGFSGTSRTSGTSGTVESKGTSGKRLHVVGVEDVVVVVI